MRRSSGPPTASSPDDVAGRGAPPTRPPRPARPAQPRISVVVPALNEAANLLEVLPELPDVHEVIVVDGGSVDDTLQVAREARPGVIAITQARRGKGNALAAGFARVTGDVVVMFDADGSADPGEIERFVAALRAGADYAKGSRFLAGGGSRDITVLRRVGNRFLSICMNLAFGTGFTDLCYGYNAFWADLVPVLDLPDPDSPRLDRPDHLGPAGVGRLGIGPARSARRRSARGRAMTWGDGFEIETLITCRLAGAGLAVTEVASIEQPRRYGSSNLHAFADGRRVLHTLRTEWLRRRAHRSARVGSGPSPRRMDLLPDLPGTSGAPSQDRDATLAS